MTPKRKQVQDYIIKLMSTLDPTNKNTKRYQELFDSMSDKEFDDYMKTIRDKKQVLILYSANITDKLRMENVVKAADMVGLKLFERIRMWDYSTQSYFLTPNKYLVLQVPVRRMSQFHDHKLAVPESDKKIDALSGQVVKPDKASSLSQVEIQTLHAKGLDNTILELIKYRGGDQTAYAEYKRQLEENGVTSVGRETGSVNRAGVIMDVLLSGTHIESNASGV